MSCYENLVMKTQMNYSRHYSTYASGGTAVVLSKQKPLPYEEQIQEFVRRVQEAECIVVGGASGLSAAGGGDFYYSDTPSFREHFGKFADKYGFKGAFSGMMHRFSTRNEHWGYVATFLNTTQNAPIREPYLDLDRILQGKDFHILTTNQDTQFVKIYPEEKVSEIQGDHRFFQCSQCCQDETWDAVQPVADMIAAMGEGTMVPDELIPRCPHCGAEMFPWVRGYGNFLQGKKYEEEYEKISKYIQKNKDRKILLIELGVGRMTPMFIQDLYKQIEKGKTYVQAYQALGFNVKALGEERANAAGKRAKQMAEDGSLYRAQIGDYPGTIPMEKMQYLKKEGMDKYLAYLEGRCLYLETALDVEKEKKRSFYQKKYSELKKAGKIK